MGVDIITLLGKVDNLHDPVPPLNNPSAALGLTISFLLLAWICGLMRLYTRAMVLHCLGWDDFFVVLVLLSTLVLTIGDALAVEAGLGRHFLLMSIKESQDFVRAFYLSNAAYPMATTFIKLALLFQYLRIYEPGSRMRMATIAVTVFTALWGFSYSFIAWFPAYPVSAYWIWTMEDAPRWGFASRDQDVFVGTYISHVASNLALDFIVFVLPAPLYFRRDTVKKMQWGLLVLFVLGAVVNVFSLLRLVSIAHSGAGTHPTLDPPWYGSTPIVLAALEVDLATACASLPVFWPTLQESLRGRIFVTREVAVTRESRRFSSRASHALGSSGGSGGGDGDDDDDIAELCVMPPPPALVDGEDGQYGVMGGVGGGDDESKGMRSGKPYALYADPFVQWRVDPLRKNKMTQTIVESNGHADRTAERAMASGAFSRLEKDSDDSLLKINFG